MRFALYTLGCKVNAYEGEYVQELMIREGYELVDFKEVADIYIINTCTVTNAADNKGLQIIRQAIRRNNEAIIIVMGCLSQTNPDLVNELQGIDIVIGNQFKSNIIKYINDFKNNFERITDVRLISSDFEGMILEGSNKTRAFVKIQDGCENFCSFCAIPFARGKCRSKSFDEVVCEIEGLVKSGKKEVVLTGIHTGNYGTDLENVRLYDLLKRIVMIPGLLRVRISSIEINEIDNNILELMKTNDIIVDHLHIPLQSGNDYVLSKMNRKYNITEFKEMVKKIREVRPDISLTTDVIVGFPGETDDMFLNTVQNIKEIGFSDIHVFPYSKRTGTVAANMDNHVDDVIKIKRADILGDLARELSTTYMSRFIGEKVDVLIESCKNGIIKGHTGNYLMVRIASVNGVRNSIVRCEIESIDYPELVGKKI